MASIITIIMFVNIYDYDVLAIVEALLLPTTHL